MTHPAPPHPVSVATLAAMLRKEAATWFTKSECLALEELIRLAQRWEDLVQAQRKINEEAEAERVARGI